MERLIINTNDIQHNIEVVRKQAGVQLIGRVDHNGYGCGTAFLARAFVSAGVQLLAASDAATVTEIRKEFPQIPVLLLSPVLNEKELACVTEQEAIATVCDLKGLFRLNGAAEEKGEHIKVYLLIRTEKNGCGISVSQAEEMATALKNCRYIEVDGAYANISPERVTHVKAVLKEKAIFDRTVSLINGFGIETPVLHMAEGYTALRYPELSYHAVRVGDAVIGRLNETDMWRLAPVGAIETEVLGQLNIAAEDEKELKTPREKRCAVVAVSSVAAVRAAAKGSLLPFVGKKITLTAGKKTFRVTGNINSSLFTVSCGKNDLREGETVRFSADLRLVNEECLRQYE